MNINPKILKEDLPLSTMIIVDEAVQRGIKYEIIHPRLMVLLTHRNHKEYLYCQGCDGTGLIARAVCKDKELTKTFLRRAGISVPDGKSFKKEQPDEAFKYAENIGWPLVLKPLDGGRGESVFANVQKDDFYNIWSKIVAKDVIIERKHHGKEYRIWATKEKVGGIINRIPANVVGDGKSTIAQLVDIKNQDPNRGNYGEPKPLKRILIDDAVIANLQSMNLTINSIVREGETVQLRDNSNLSTGGDSVDCFDEAHSSVFDLAIKAINSIPNLAYAGIDLMTQDITKPQTPDNHVIIEINDVPGIDGITFPAIGKPRNVAAEIINIMFPETRQ